MAWLLIVSFVWAFSFGLIKGRLTGVDPALVSLVRVGLAFFVFAPLLRPRLLPPRAALLLAGIGAVQFGLMYVCYIAAFQTLAAYEVAALTIFTPIFVAIADAAVSRHLRALTWAAAALAVLGAGVIVVDKPLAAISWAGVLLVQGSNLCFAAGQIAWRHWQRRHPEAPGDRRHAAVRLARPARGDPVVRIPLVDARLPGRDRLRALLFPVERRCGARRRRLIGGGEQHQDPAQRGVLDLDFRRDGRPGAAPGRERGHRGRWLSRRVERSAGRLRRGTSLRGALIAPARLAPDPILRGGPGSLWNRQKHARHPGSFTQRPGWILLHPPVCAQPPQLACSTPGPCVSSSGWRSSPSGLAW